MRAPLAILLLLSFAPLVAADEEGALRGLDVLLVCPKPENGAWIETLLTEHGARVTLTGWSSAGVERAAKFDLVVVTGGQDRPDGREVAGYTIPVLGVGSAGHGYFGALHLKHGFPFS